jgi:hypothetical protein
MMIHSQRAFFSSIRAISLFSIGVIAMPHFALAQEQLGPPTIDNARVSAWETTLVPGKPLSLGQQNTDSVLLFLEGGKIQTKFADGRNTTESRNPGDAIYEPKGTKESIEVTSSNHVPVVIVDLKDGAASGPANTSGLPPAFPRPGARKVLDNARIAVWDYTFKPGVSSAKHFHDKDSLVAFRYQGSIESDTPDGKSAVSDYKPDDIRFLPSGRIHSEKLVKGHESIIVVEFK